MDFQRVSFNFIDFNVFHAASSHSWCEVEKLKECRTRSVSGGCGWGRSVDGLWRGFGVGRALEFPCEELWSPWGHLKALRGLFSCPSDPLGTSREFLSSSSSTGFSMDSSGFSLIFIYFH